MKKKNFAFLNLVMYIFLHFEAPNPLPPPLSHNFFYDDEQWHFLFLNLKEGMQVLKGKALRDMEA